MEKKIEEILGYTTARGLATETIARRYYVMDESPEMAKKAFEAYADSLPVPADMELGDVSLDEDTNSSNLFYGTINFRFPDPKIKRQIAKDLFEVYGEKISEGRKTGSHERVFRIESDTARNAEQRLENYIRGTMPTSGRLHINNITVDEAEDGTGFFLGRVEYSNPDTFGSRDKLNGIVPAYGSRYSGNKKSRNREHIYELRGYQSVQDAWHALNGNFGGHPDIETIDVEEDSGGAERLFTGRIRYLQDGPFNTTDLDTFCERIVFRGVVPEKTHSDRFAIIQQDAEPDICVRAVISGPSIARIDVEKEPESLDGLTCRAIEGETDLLELGGGGAAVLWIDKGSGERWAIILLGASTVTIHVGTVSGEIKPGTDPDNEEYGGTVDEEDGESGLRAFAGMLVEDDIIEKGTRVEWLRIGGINRIINADCKGSDDDEDKDEEGKTTSE